MSLNMREMEIINESRKEQTDNKNTTDKPEDSEELIGEIKDYDKLTADIQNEIIIKDCKYYREKLKKLIKPILIFVGFGLSYLLYYLSLESCNDGEGACSTYISWIKLKVIEEIISCILLTIMLQTIIFKIISRIHLIHIIIIFILFYNYRHGLDFVDHGYFNFLFYLIIVFGLSLIVLPLDILICCLKNGNNKKLIIIYLISFFIFVITVYIYLFNFKASCIDWTKGLNNTSLVNNSTKYGCQIHSPKTCAYKVFGFLQDYTKLKGLDCKSANDKEFKDIILEFTNSPYITKETLRFGFPLTNIDPVCFKFFTKDNPIYEYVSNNMVDMDNKEILDKHFKDKMPEIYVDFSDNGKGKLFIDVHFNKTLSDERKLKESNTNPYSRNVLLLYIDSLSRANAMRQLKKTLNFFERFMSYKGGFNEKYPSEIFHSFQFFKYHAFGGFTFFNYPILFYGQKRQENNTKYPLYKYFKENGFITCNVHDYCAIENTDTYHDFTFDDIFDHQFLPCDPNNNDFNINIIRCLYDKQNMEYFLEYIEQFWRKYKDNRKFASLFSNHGHEGTLSVIKHQDELLANFLNRLFDDNLLKDTTIILLSDHGVGMPSIYFPYDFYHIEIELPALFIIINDRKNINYEKQYKYIQENQQNFITGFDIYNTMGNIIYGDNYDNIPNKTLEIDSCKSTFGISLFNKINSKERLPRKFSSISSMGEGVCY